LRNAIMVSVEGRKAFLLIWPVYSFGHHQESLRRGRRGRRRSAVADCGGKGAGRTHPAATLECGGTRADLSEAQRA
jgi:hypothetical protein